MSEETRQQRRERERREGAPRMITRDDPRRRHLHDYFLVDPTTGRDLGGFATQEEAAAYALEHLRGRVTVLDIAHPPGCRCPGARNV